MLRRTSASSPTPTTATVWSGEAAQHQLPLRSERRGAGFVLAAILSRVPGPMHTTANTSDTGARVERGRYDTDHGERVLVGRRIEGEVFVHDHPVGPGRPYFVERGFPKRSRCWAATATSTSTRLSG
jgi:hypothetical protein